MTNRQGFQVGDRVLVMGGPCAPGSGTVVHVEDGSMGITVLVDSDGENLASHCPYDAHELVRMPETEEPAHAD